MARAVSCSKHISSGCRSAASNEQNIGKIDFEEGESATSFFLKQKPLVLSIAQPYPS